MTELLDLVNQVANIKSDIQTAIINKGVSVSNSTPFTSYASKINDISSGSTINNQDLLVTENGEYQAESGYTGLGTVTVNVASGGTASAERDAIITRTLSGSYTIPNSITTIGENAFKGCEQLTSVDLNNVEMIYTYGFADCHNLQQVTNASKITDISTRAFENTNLATFPFGPNVKHIEWSFAGCQNLDNIDLSSTSCNFVSGAFENCSSLTNIIMPNNEYMLDSQAFHKCKSLKSIDLKNVSSIGYEVFANCPSLEYVKINNTIDNQSLDSSTFNNDSQPIIVQIDKETDSVSGYPWGGSDVTVFWSNNTPYSITVNCLNQGINPDITLTSGGTTLNKNWWMYESGTSVTYNVSYRNYLAQSNTITLNSDETISVTLLPDPNPTYYQIKEDSIHFSGDNTSISQNEFGDDSILNIDCVYNEQTQGVMDAGCTITDEDWDDYCENFGDVSLNNFQDLADEFVIKFKWNYNYNYPEYEIHETIYNLFYESLEIQGKNSCFSIDINKNNSDVMLNIGTYVNGDFQWIWHYGFTVSSIINNYLTFSFKFDSTYNCWKVTCDGNPYQNWEYNYNGKINIPNNILQYNLEWGQSYQEDKTETISIDFYESGFKKNGQWVYRMLETKPNA